jgi:uncharacterized protein YfaS (alpha-2-macroglobulin family)
LADMVRQIEALQSKDGYYVGYRLVSETGLQESRDIFDRSGDPVGQHERHEIWRTALALDFLTQVRGHGIRVNDTGVQLGIAALRDTMRGQLRDSSFYASDAEQDDADPKLNLTEDKDSPLSAQPAGAGPAASNVVQRMRARPASLMQKLLVGKKEGKEDKRDEDDVEDTSKPYGRTNDPCNEDLLYATFVLARNDAIDRFDLASLMKQCSQRGTHPIGAAMLAAALNKFGVLEDANAVLVSIEGRGGATGNGMPNDRFDAMMLAFLTLADASSSLKNELVVRLTNSNRPLSLATRAWLARAYAEPTRQSASNSRPIGLEIVRLPIETRTEREIVTGSMKVADLAERPVDLRNTGSEPLTVALSLNGIPKQESGTPAGGIKMTRRFINQQGQTIDLQRTRLKPNDLIYVILSGQRELENKDDNKMRLQDPILIVDRLAASFEIVDRDLFEFARSDGVDLRAVLPSDGKLGRLRVAEARDDQLLAIVKPTQDGKFQIGYSVRAAVAGQFVHPGAIAEDLYRSDQTVRLKDGLVTVEAGVRP